MKRFLPPLLSIFCLVACGQGSNGVDALSSQSSAVDSSDRGDTATDSGQSCTDAFNACMQNAEEAIAADCSAALKACQRLQQRGGNMDGGCDKNGNMSSNPNS